MKPTIAIILSLLSSTAFAQTWTPAPLPLPAILPPSPPPVTYQQFGNRTYGSDGSTAQTYGNRVYVTPADPAQPQVVCTTYGNQTTCQ